MRKRFITPLLFTALVLTGCKDDCDSKNTVKIRDNKFRELCLKKFDFDGNGIFTREEAAQVEELILTSEKITSLEGIEAFTALRYLDCSDNLLTSANLRNNTKLEVLNINFNAVSKLDVSHLTELKELHCTSGAGNPAGKKLSEINIGSNPKLEKFSCANNLITKIDFSNNPEIRELRLGDNKLTTLDVSGLRKLKMLYCGYNALSSVKLGEHPDLAQLDLTVNKLTQADFSGCPKLIYISVSTNPVTGIDISRNPELKTLFCVDCNLTDINTSANPKLFSFNCTGNDIRELDIRNNTKLFSFACLDNPRDKAQAVRIRVWESFDINSPPDNFRKPETAYYYK